MYGFWHSDVFTVSLVSTTVVYSHMMAGISGMILGKFAARKKKIDET